MPVPERPADKPMVTIVFNSKHIDPVYGWVHEDLGNVIEVITDTSVLVIPRSAVAYVSAPLTTFD